MKLQLRSVGLAVLETQREAVKDGHLCACVGAGAVGPLSVSLSD